MKKIIVACAAMLALACCQQEYAIKPLGADTTIPTLTNPFVTPSTATRFIPFGGNLDAGGVSAAYVIYLTDTSSSVQSTTKGYVKTVTQNPIGDYRIELEPKRNSIFKLIYDHVKQPAVVAGDSVSFSTVLGKIGVGGIASLQVNRTLNNATVALCLDSIASSSFKTSINTAIQKHNTAHPSEPVSSPCLVGSIAQ